MKFFDFQKGEWYMKIQWIEIENFKGFETSKRFEFFQNTLIGGHTGQGKSTIAEAIVFILYGKTLNGESRIDDVKNVNSAASKEVKGTVCFLETLTHKTFEITRIKKGSRYSIEINGDPSTQQSIDSLIADADIFLSVFNPKFFTECLDNNEKRAIIERITDRIDWEDFFVEAAGDLSLLETYCYDLYEKNDYKRVKTEIDSLKEKMVEMKTEAEVLNNENLNLPSIYKQELNSEEEALKVKFEVSEKFIKQKENLIRKIESSKESESEAGKLELELKGIPEENSDSDPHAKIKEYTERKNAKLKENHAQLSDLRNRIQSEASIPKTVEDVGRCPTCYQEISEEWKNKVNHKILDKLNEIKESNLEISKKILDIENENAKIEEKYNEVCRSLTDASNLAIRNKTRREEIKKQIENLKAKFFLPSEEEKKILSFDNSKIKQDYERIVEFNRNVTFNNEKMNEIENRKNDNKRRIKELRDGMIVLSGRVSDLEKIQKGLSPSYLLRKTVEKQIELLDPLLTNVEIKLIKENKNKSFSDTFDIFWKNPDRPGMEPIPYRRISNSEKVKCSLELSKMINELVGKEIPIFIDNFESIVEIPESEFKKTQLIKAKVEEGKTLEIRDALLTK